MLIQCAYSQHLNFFVFVPGKPFQPSLIFQALHFRVGSGLTRKY
jgi:hypothetical protein